MSFALYSPSVKRELYGAVRVLRLAGRFRHYDATLFLPDGLRTWQMWVWEDNGENAPVCHYVYDIKRP
jgi:hypothetical protein